MFNFYKGFNKNQDTKIVTSYIRMTDIDRINKIREQREGLLNKKEEKQEKSYFNENKDIYHDRINALRNIKKD